jgi:hypothetical protein
LKSMRGPPQIPHVIFSDPQKREIIEEYTTNTIRP